MEPIDHPDVTNTDPEYWENVLKSHKLSMTKGSSPYAWVDRGTETERKIMTVLSVGGLNNIVGIDEQEYRKSAGRVTPSGKGSKD